MLILLDKRRKEGHELGSVNLEGNGGEGDCPIDIHWLAISLGMLQQDRRWDFWGVFWLWLVGSV